MELFWQLRECNIITGNEYTETTSTFYGIIWNLFSKFSVFICKIIIFLLRGYLKSRTSTRGSILTQYYLLKNILLHKKYKKIYQIKWLFSLWLYHVISCKHNAIIKISIFHIKVKNYWNKITKKLIIFNSDTYCLLIQSWTIILAK